MGQHSSRPTAQDEAMAVETSPHHPPDEPKAPPPPTVPHLFRWAEGGESVFIAGSFNGWREKIPMQRGTGATFTVMLSLPPGFYEFKFVVDNAWRFSKNLPSTSDRNGNINNFVDILPIQKAEAEDISIADTESTHGSTMEFSQSDPSPVDTAKDAPPLPPHFQQAYLPMNKVCDSDQPPVPSHILLNHAMYAASPIALPSSSPPPDPANKFDMLRVSCAIRFRGKFVTVVLHKPLPQPQHV